MENGWDNSKYCKSYRTDNKKQIIKGFLWAPEMSSCSGSTKARTLSKWKIHSEKLTLQCLISMDY